MRIGSGFVNKPGSPTEPAAERTITVIDGVDKKTVHVRFAYLSEMERIRAMTEGARYADKQFGEETRGGQKIADPDIRELAQKHFILARALRDAEDVDKQAFTSPAGNIPVGAALLAAMPFPTLRDTFDAWWLWMEKEFGAVAGVPDRAPSESEMEEATRDAQGESSAVRT